VDCVAQQVSDLLAARPAHGRNENGDDAVFAPLANQTTRAFQGGEYRLAIAMYRRCMQLADQYEAAHPGAELHRGTPAFNAGLALLRSYDFPAALHYFELAQREMRLTTGGDGWNIFNNPAFDAHFWLTVEGGANTYPLPLFHSLWGQPLNRPTARAMWNRLSRHSKMPFVVAHSERIRLRQIVDQSGLQSSRALALAYWAMIGDLLRLLETEIQRRAALPAPKPNTLFPLLSGGFVNTRCGNISAAFGAIHIAAPGPINSSASFNARFAALRDAINDETRPRNERIHHAIYLLYGTRNQVQHHVDRNLLIYRSLPAAVFITQVLFCLCRLESWARRP
jgi:hypothetical protein